MEREKIRWKWGGLYQPIFWHARSLAFEGEIFGRSLREGKYSTYELHQVAVSFLCKVRRKRRYESGPRKGKEGSMDRRVRR